MGSDGRQPEHAWVCPRMQAAQPGAGCKQAAKRRCTEVALRRPSHHPCSVEGAVEEAAAQQEALCRVESSSRLQKVESKSEIQAN